MRLLPFACLLVLSCLSSCTAETEAGEGGSLSAEDELLLQGVEDTANTFEGTSICLTVFYLEYVPIIMIIIIILFFPLFIVYIPPTHV